MATDHDSPSNGHDKDEDLPEILTIIDKFDNSPPDKQQYDYCLPVPKSYLNATLKGVYVPRYRQHTSLVAAGYAANKSRLDNYIEILDKAHESDNSYDSLSASN